MVARGHPPIGCAPRFVRPRDTTANREMHPSRADAALRQPRRAGFETAHSGCAVFPPFFSTRQRKVADPGKGERLAPAARSSATLRRPASMRGRKGVRPVERPADSLTRHARWAVVLEARAAVPTMGRQLSGVSSAARPHTIEAQIGCAARGVNSHEGCAVRLYPVRKYLCGAGAQMRRASVPRRDAAPTLLPANKRVYRTFKYRERSGFDQYGIRDR